MRFDELELSDDVLDALDAMRFGDCTPIQEQAIPLIFSRRDLIAVAQTGTGKTAAYLLPVIDMLADEPEPVDSVSCIVMSPTRELAQQIDRQLEGFSRLRERMAQINDADELRNWKNPVNGDELMEHFGLPAGRWIQGIKEAVKEAVMEGTIPYDHDSAWKYALSIAGEYIGNEKS